MCIIFHLGTREAYEDYTLVGKVYQELIRLSSSRSEALQRIVEFEQLLLDYKSKHQSQMLPFPGDAIDDVCITAYNNGLTLFELGQIHLAESFVAKSVNLLNLATEKLAVWKSTIEVIYFILPYL